MRLGKALLCAAICALAFRARNVHCEYPAQFSRGCISVKVVHRCTHFHSPSPDQVAVHRGTAALGWLQGSVVFLAGESLPRSFERTYAPHLALETSHAAPYQLHRNSQD